MLQLYLYTTSHCHLCEQAEALLNKLSKQHPFHWQSIEIADNTELLETYGLLIPVIKNINHNSEIKWPFTENELKKFIHMQSNR